MHAAEYRADSDAASLTGKVVRVDMDSNGFVFADVIPLRATGTEATRKHRHRVYRNAKNNKQLKGVFRYVHPRSLANPTHG